MGCDELYDLKESGMGMFHALTKKGGSRGWFTVLDQRSLCGS